MISLLESWEHFVWFLFLFSKMLKSYKWGWIGNLWPLWATICGANNCYKGETNMVVFFKEIHSHLEQICPNLWLEQTSDCPRDVCQRSQDFPSQLPKDSSGKNNKTLQVQAHLLYLGFDCLPADCKSWRDLGNFGSQDGQPLWHHEAVSPILLPNLTTSGWHKLCNPASRALRIFPIYEDFWGFLWSKGVKMRPAIEGEKAVLSPRSSIFNPQSSVLIPQSSVLRNAPKNLIYGILVANVAKI